MGSIDSTVTMPLSETTINQLVAARHLYFLAKQNIESEQTARLFSGVNLLHDSIETALWAAATARNVGRDRIELLQLFDAVSATLTPGQLPFRSAAVQLNRIRINSKHYGIAPDRKESLRLLTQMTEFLAEAAAVVFGTNFWTVSLIRLLSEKEAKNLLTNAEALFDQKDYCGCIIECRKMIFVEFESRYTIDEFRHPDALRRGVFGPSSDAPYFTKSHEWIEGNVRDPFGYIVLDHSHLDHDLLRKGINTESFWNIWRGTPDVFRYHNSKDWLVRRDLAKEANPVTEEHAVYILQQAIEIALSLEEYAHQFRTWGHSGTFFVTLKSEGVNIYHKADRESTILAVTHAGLRRITVSGSTPGLRNDGQYWQAGHFELDGSGRFYFGYICEGDIVLKGSAPQLEIEPAGGETS
jgi:hypothetical protein